MSVARNLENVSLSDIRNVLGQNGKKSGENWLFQCPICRDKGENNLIVKGNGAYIHCFSCVNNEGGKYVLSEIERKRRNENVSKPINISNSNSNSNSISISISNEPPRFLDKELQEQYITYMLLANDLLLNNSELLELLYEKRGIDRQTVIDCGIGYDDTEEHWVLPIFSLKYENTLMGFEYRRKNFDKYDNGSKVRREKGYIADLCPIWGRDKSDILIISEGFWDGYALHQYLRNSKCKDSYTIYSCSNGVTSLLNVMNRICFSNFKEIKLILDTDDAGNKVTKEIVNKYSFIKDKREFLFKDNCKDVNEWLIRRMKRC